MLLAAVEHAQLSELHQKLYNWSSFDCYSELVDDWNIIPFLTYHVNYLRQRWEFRQIVRYFLTSSSSTRLLAIFSLLKMMTRVRSIGKLTCSSHRTDSRCIFIIIVSCYTHIESICLKFVSCHASLIRSWRIKVRLWHEFELLMRRKVVRRTGL